MDYLLKKYKNYNKTDNEMEMEYLLNKNQKKNYNEIDNKKVKNKKVYGIITWQNFTYDGKMDSMIYVSEDKFQTKKVLNYLNEKLDDEEIIDYIIEFSKDCSQEAKQVNIREKTFVMIELYKFVLEKYYKKLYQIISCDINLTYDVICIEGMINQTQNKIISSRLNDKYYKLKSLEKIRKYFNDEYII